MGPEHARWIRWLFRVAGRRASDAELGDLMEEYATGERSPLWLCRQVLSTTRRYRPLSAHERGDTAMLSNIWRDVRYALRTFRRNPGFAVAAVAPIALGDRHQHRRLLDPQQCGAAAAAGAGLERAGQHPPALPGRSRAADPRLAQHVLDARVPRLPGRHADAVRSHGLLAGVDGHAGRRLAGGDRRRARQLQLLRRAAAAARRRSRLHLRQLRRSAGAADRDPESRSLDARVCRRPRASPARRSP